MMGTLHTPQVDASDLSNHVGAATAAAHLYLHKHVLLYGTLDTKLIPSSVCNFPSEQINFHRCSEF